MVCIKLSRDDIDIIILGLEGLIGRHNSDIKKLSPKKKKISEKNFESTRKLHSFFQNI